MNTLINSTLNEVTPASTQKYSQKSAINSSADTMLALNQIETSNYLTCDRMHQDVLCFIVKAREWISKCAKTCSSDTKNTMQSIDLSVGRFCVSQQESTTRVSLRIALVVS